MTHQEIIDRWNAQADEFNQWDALGEDEKLEWAMALEREACAKVAERFEPDEKTDYVTYASTAIRARGQA